MRVKLTKREVDGLTARETPYEIWDTEVPGLVLRVQPSGLKNYYALYRRDDGRKRRVKVGDAAVVTVEMARSEARKKLADAVQGKDPAEEKKRLRRIPVFGDFVEAEYGPWVVTARKSGKATVQRLKVAFKFLWRRRMDQIGCREVEAWQAKRIADKVSNATINRELTMLKAVLARAVEWGHLARHPIERLKRLKEDAQPKVRYLTHAEYERLVNALDAREEAMRAARDSHNKWLVERNRKPVASLRTLAFADHLKPMVVLSVHTGLRRGELFSLSWEDVNLELGLLSVRGSLSKSGNTRHIPLNSVARDTLARWREQGPGDGLVFPNKVGERFNNVDTSWDGVLLEADITGVTWHTLRHTFASWLVQSGVDLYTVQKLLGHASIRITERYSHLSPSVRAAAVERIAEVQPKNVVPFVAERAEDAPLASEAR